SLSDVTIIRYSVGVQHKTLISSDSNKCKYLSALKPPLYTNPVAPEPSTDKNGLHTHFCQPGAAVAHTLSDSLIPSQFAATLRRSSDTHQGGWTPVLRLLVVPDVYGRHAISSLLDV